jgi:hypothetical protein
MPDFPLILRVNPCRTDQGQIVVAKRAYLQCALSSRLIACDTLIDTGAPFCVVPYTLGKLLAWQRVATSFTTTSGGVGSVLHWQGIPCELGSTTLYCIHPTGLRSRTLLMVAKFALRPGTRAWERTAVLGLNFMEDNQLELVLRSPGRPLEGFLRVP